MNKMFGQLFAGVGLGLLVGVLVGLSSSPVVSVVVGALASGMVTLLGFVRSPKDGEAPLSDGSVVRLGGFGVACAAAVLFGLFIRTHNWLSPSIADQVAEVQRAGYSGEEARRWVAYKNVGAVLEPAISGAAGTEPPDAHGPDAHGADAHGGGPAPAKALMAAAQPVAGSVLFAGGNSGECQYFDTSRYKDTPEHLYSLRQMGGNYAKYAEKISTLDATEQKKVLDALRLLFCAK